MSYIDKLQIIYFNLKKKYNLKNDAEVCVAWSKNPEYYKEIFSVRMELLRALQTNQYF